MRREDCAEAREVWKHAGGDEWARRNVEEIDHETTDRQRIGKPRREIDLEHLEAVPRYASVLEIGSGYGRQLQDLREMGFSRFLAGIDINLVALHRSDYPGAQADWTHLPFGDGSVDMVCASGTLMHVHPTQMRQVVDEMLRVTRRWFWCFEQISPEFKTLNFAPHLQIPPAWILDLPALLVVLRPELVLSKGHVWEGPKGKYAMLLYDKML